MNLLSIGASLGVVVVIFQWGWFGKLMGVQPGPVESFIPVMLFAIVFGLSMDYEVFLVSRIHERWVHTRDNSRAVAEGLALTGRVVSAAATIMVLVFLSFMLGEDRVIKEFGLALSSAVFLDALVIRCMLLPATLHLLGERTWWIPSWLDRILPELHRGQHAAPRDPRRRRARRLTRRRHGRGTGPRGRRNGSGRLSTAARRLAAGLLGRPRSALPRPALSRPRRSDRRRYCCSPPPESTSWRTAACPWDHVRRAGHLLAVPAAAGHHPGGPIATSAYPHPRPPALTLGPTGSVIGDGGTALERAARAPAQLLPGLLASSIPGGAAYASAGPIPDAPRPRAGAAGRGRVAARAATLAGRIAALP